MVYYRLINEAYISKASFINRDDFNQKEFSGRRIKRSLYKNKKATLMNADKNSSADILRKRKHNILETDLKV